MRSLREKSCVALDVVAGGVVPVGHVGYALVPVSRPMPLRAKRLTAAW